MAPERAALDEAVQGLHEPEDKRKWLFSQIAQTVPILPAVQLVALQLLGYGQIAKGSDKGWGPLLGIVQYPFVCLKLDKYGLLVQTAPCGQVWQFQTDWSLVGKSYKYSSFLQAPHGGNSQPVCLLLGILPLGQSLMVEHFSWPLVSV